VNWQHLGSVLWLRWRIRVNQVKRAGTVNAVVTAIFFALFLLAAAISFVGAIPIGMYLLNDVQTLILMAVWDALTVAFLFCWMIGIVTELQRSESLSPDKFLHLPVSMSGVFLINYLSSLATLTAVAFLPAMTGLTVGLAASRGFALLWGLPLIAAFFWMVTALTYQFRGWLAALMSNPRRRRTIIVCITIVFVLIAQLPNLINMWAPWHELKAQSPPPMSERENDLLKQRQVGTITPDDYVRRSAEIRGEEKKQADDEKGKSIRELGWWLRLGNQVLPPAWLSWGVTSAAEGQMLPPILGIAGMSLIGAASLVRAYRTTIRYYTGQTNSRAAPSKDTRSVAMKSKAVIDHSRTTLLERRIPRVSEYASAIATSGLRSLLRAPEAKMMFLSPIILTLVFGSMLFRESMDVEVPVRPLFAIGAVAMTMFGMVQFVGNQFGFDRGGFRVFVLCPAPRRDVLLGKNLAMAPFALGMAWVLIALIQIVRPMRWDHLLAMAPQSVAMYLIFCLMANWLSILAPMPIAAGSMKPTSPKFSVVIVHILFTFALPLALAPTLAPWLAEFLIGMFGGGTRVPVFLLGAILELAGAAFLYYALLNAQGNTLQCREQKLLDVVSKKAE
jgi:ABC-2 type transport system permease protein